MREVRMTFGEHLEELRRRIIFALLYLAGGVVLSLAYGSQLMEYALEPHFRAFRAAQRDRIVTRMERTADRLAELASVEPAEPKGGDRPLLEGEIHWEVLFLRDVALPQLYARLEAPYVETAEALRRRAAESPEGLRGFEANLAETLLSLGRASARVLVAEFAPELEREEYARIPERFQQLVERLEALEKERSGGGAWLQRTLGWGKDLGATLERLERFSEFLRVRRREAVAAETPLDSLRARARESRLPRVLGDILAELEKDASSLAEGVRPRIWVISYTENFAAYIKVAVIVGALIALPGILYEMWKFIGAGLYPHEQKYVVTVLPFSLLLFAVGAAFGYYVLIPVGLRFLAAWSVQDVELSFTLGSYIGLFFTLTLVLGLIFQTPLLMVFLAKVGIIDVAGFRKWRRAAAFIGVCLAVVLTPPDPFSWALMAAPLLGLYEIGILAAAIFARAKPATEEAAEATA